MTPRKIASAALFFCVLGTALLLPPLVLVFNTQMRVLGLPTELIYLFSVWLVLILGTRWFAYRLPDDERQEGGK